MIVITTVVIGALGTILGECNGLVRKVESTTADIFGSAQLSPILGYCSYLAEKVMSLRYGIVAETWMRISRKRTREDHTLIMIIIIIIIIIIMATTIIMITNNLK